MPTVGSVFRIAIVLAIGALPVTAADHPSFSGTWKMNTAATDSTSGPSDVVFEITHKEPYVKYTATGKSGSIPFSETYEFLIGGSAPADSRKLSVAGSWQGQTLVLRYTKDGKQLAAIELQLADDGKRMTRRGEFGGRKIDEVYYRQR